MRRRWNVAGAGIGTLAMMAGSPAIAGEATVERGDVIIRFERRAKVEPLSKRPVRYEPEVFGGRLELAERAREPGAVKAGDVLMVLASRDFSDQFEDAKVLAAEAERRLDLTRTEKRIGLEQTKVAGERAEFASRVAGRALDLFQRFDSAKVLEQREIGLQWQRDSLKDETTELEQLEKMYQGTTLADETKDLVLERARRSLARNQRQIRHAEQDYKNYIEFLHPQTTRQVEDAAKFAEFDLMVARENARLAAVRAELDLAGAERGARDAKRRAERLERDRERLTLRAPTDGYWLPQLREAGEQAQPWQSVGEVADISALRIKGSLDPAALRVLAGEDGVGSIVGRMAHVRFPARPEVNTSTTISELVTVGAPEGESTAFAFIGQLPDSAGAMVGFDAIVYGKRTLSNVLTVPEKAVKGLPTRPQVRVKTADAENDVDVTVGPSADGRIVIIEGLSEGDRVVVPDA